MTYLGQRGNLSSIAEPPDTDLCFIVVARHMDGLRETSSKRSDLGPSKGEAILSRSVRPSKHLGDKLQGIAHLEMRILGRLMPLATM